MSLSSILSFKEGVEKLSASLLAEKQKENGKLISSKQKWLKWKRNMKLNLLNPRKEKLVFKTK